MLKVILYIVVIWKAYSFASSFRLKIDQLYSVFIARIYFCKWVGGRSRLFVWEGGGLFKQVLSSLISSSFRCTNGDFYVALGSSRPMGLALLVWVGGGLLKRVL